MTIDPSRVVNASRSIRAKDAAKFLGICYRTLMKWAAIRPDFPKPFWISAKTPAFIEDELIRWRDAQIQASRSQTETAESQTAKSAVSTARPMSTEGDSHNVA